MPINNEREFKQISWKIPNKTYAKLRAYSNWKIYKKICGGKVEVN